MNDEGDNNGGRSGTKVPNFMFQTCRRGRQGDEDLVSNWDHWELIIQHLPNMRIMHAEPGNNGMLTLLTLDGLILHD